MEKCVRRHEKTEPRHDGQGAEPGRHEPRQYNHADRDRESINVHGPEQAFGDSVGNVGVEPRDEAPSLLQEMRDENERGKENRPAERPPAISSRLGWVHGGGNRNVGHDAFRTRPAASKNAWVLRGTTSRYSIRIPRVMFTSIPMRLGSIGGVTARRIIAAPSDQKLQTTNMPVIQRAICLPRRSPRLSPITTTVRMTAFRSAA